MKTFWAIWNREFAPAVAVRLGLKEGEAAWSAAEELPPAQDVIAVTLRWDETGIWRGSVTLLAARAEIAALLAENGVPELEGQRHEAEQIADSKEEEPSEGETLAARWVEWLQDVLATMPLPAPPAHVERSTRPHGVPLTPYVLRAGAVSVYMAMICDLSETSPAKAPENVASPANRPEPSGATQDFVAPGTATSQAASNAANLDLLLDIEVDASLRFGSRELALRDLLDAGPGDVLELDRHISDPVDLVVGDKIVARGEVVLVNGNFGLRVTEVAEPKKCLESVRCLF
jgi:flagellar motor switch protein FliN/FliY